jgi:hypothetical protein
MSVQRLGWLAGIVSVLGLTSSGTLAADADAQRAVAPEPWHPPVLLGVMADAGVPDGANAALVLRPAGWLRVHLGGGSNTVSAGYRGGITLMLPHGAGPSLNLEVGHYRDGAANALVRTFVGGQGPLKPLFERFGYTYVNAQVGLEFGRGPVQFFVHGGVSHLSATLHDAADALARVGGARDPSTTVLLRQDPVVRVWTPSAKMGLLVYFGAPR